MLNDECAAIVYINSNKFSFTHIIQYKKIKFLIKYNYILILSLNWAVIIFQTENNYKCIKIIRNNYYSDYLTR